MSKITIPRVELQPQQNCSLSCLGCQHGSPQRSGEPPRSAADYRPHLARLHEFAEWPFTFVGGGEPFLHADLAGFLDGVRDGPWHKSLHLITNGFWLLRKDWYEFAEPALKRADVLIVSRYPAYVERLGVAEWDARIDVIRECLGIEVTSFHEGDPKALAFGQNGYHAEPRPVPSPNPCRMKWCLQLLPDGRLAKCPLGLWLDRIPNATPEFRASYAAHSYYDLARLPEGLDDFANRETHPACRLCGLGTGDVWMVGWSSDSRVKSATGDEYEALIRRGTLPVVNR